MEDKINYWRNARTLRAFSVLFFGLLIVSLLLVHLPSYEPAVTFVLLYLTVAVGVTGAGVLALLPAEMFSAGFSAGAYTFYAVVLGLAVFFSGGLSSELYVLYFPLLLSSALHGSWKVGVASLVSALLVYLFAVTPDLLASGEAGALFFRLVLLGLAGGFVLTAARGSVGGGRVEEYATDEDGTMLLDLVSGEISAGRKEQVAVVLVDPGRGVGDVDLLLERVRDRVAEPILLGEGAVFGMVLSGVDERSVESAAGRALAVAGSLGARASRAGAAVYPRDARKAGDLLAAAGQALETAFETDTPNVVLAGRVPEDQYRAAR
jgi:hypothetical protein